MGVWLHKGGCGYAGVRVGCGYTGVRVGCGYTELRSEHSIWSVFITA